MNKSLISSNIEHFNEVFEIFEFQQLAYNWMKENKEKRRRELRQTEALNVKDLINEAIVLDDPSKLSTLTLRSILTFDISIRIPRE